MRKRILVWLVASLAVLALGIGGILAWPWWHANRPFPANAIGFDASPDDLTLTVTYTHGVGEPLLSSRLVSEGQDRVDVEVILEGPGLGAQPAMILIDSVDFTLSDPLGDRQVFASGIEVPKAGFTLDPSGNEPDRVYRREDPSDPDDPWWGIWNPQHVGVSTDGITVEFRFMLGEGDEIALAEVVTQDARRVVVKVWEDEWDGGLRTGIGLTRYATVTLDEPLGDRQLFIFDEEILGRALLDSPG